MGKILKPAGGKRSAVMSYTKHYYIGSERISAKTGTCVNIGYYPQGYLAAKMPNLDENLVRTSSDDKVDKAENNINYVHEKLSLNPPALNSTDDYVEESSNFNHLRNQLDYFYFHPDHLGSSSYITNAAGMVSQHLEYLPFGELLVDEHTNSYNSPFKYNGKEFDEETGNYFYGARYYDPKWSIFISVDPLAEKYPDWNPYHYVHQNPINLIDPTGMEADDWKKDSLGNYVYDANLTAQNASTQLGANETYLGESYSFNVNNSDGSQLGTVNLNADGTAGYTANGQTTEFDNTTVDLGFKSGHTIKTGSWQTGDTFDKGNWIVGAAASGLEYTPGSFRFGTAKQGLSPKYYPSGWTGNQYAKTFNIGKIGQGLGLLAFAAGTVKDGYGVFQYYNNPGSPNAVHPGKAGLNLGMGALGLTGWGTPASLLYGAMEAFHPQGAA